MKPALLLLTVAVCCSAQTPSLNFLNHNRPVLDAHNCYPDSGQWSDRIERALAAGFPVGIEQDLTWYVDPVSKQGRAVVAHNDKPDGSEPLLRELYGLVLENQVQLSEVLWRTSLPAEASTDCYSC